MTNTDIATKTPAIVSQFRTDLTRMESQFHAALPEHIPAARFARVVMTAVQRDPKLLACDRQSLFNACMQAASDGLLPDGREGVLLPFSSDDDEKVRSGSKVSWIPMVFGLRKKVRNAGVLSDWNVQVVQDGDAFDYELGDRPYIRHKPAPRGGRNRPVLFAYSIATYPDGTISREVMNIDQIKDIQKLSRAKKGPWSNPTFFPEMARKTVARLHSKQLPMSTDLDTIMRRDDALYDFEGAKARERAAKVERPNSVSAALEFFGSGGVPADDAGDTGEDGSRGATPKPDAATKTGQSPPAGPPKNAKEYSEFARKVIDDAKTAEEALSLQPWFASEAQRKMRNGCGVDKEGFDQVQAWINDKIASFKS